VSGRSLAIALVLIVVARPLAVFASTMFTGSRCASGRCCRGRAARRGAIVLATFPLVRGLPQAELIFDVVFFVVVTSVLVQGTATP